ncbi:hypothetical protein [Heyndrickxia sporothermodurans]|uniref:Uncharacterized protein n=1 Tax=Heyndrickxia sporothermodurans TaxID=46224 RepID=A0AB37HDI4_9BACI|nr:hypothetical protein [Heyndrickxia sporothermodurans]MED1711685.1 hypothetical protein [Bacillus thuringiensis]MBL5767741.1 hypothetical protein [Heyndrickxia sporothermodurans]MBL5771247.1 hypothetical protein [Heyndrickxia sporothermodurans]MBL5775721.1 hypothetical protein [Heyndrickxia sporothermodurans]MBL5780057.1 hypothetical protein [Heyndrickxia sporothermodurans]
MEIKKATLALNVEDPEQAELYEFVTLLPNGKKRNASAFLKTLVDREYQKKREWYLEEKEKAHKKAPVIKSVNGGLSFKIK